MNVLSCYRSYHTCFWWFFPVPAFRRSKEITKKLPVNPTIGLVIFFIQFIVAKQLRWQVTPG